jgi:hypothetical protein
MTGVALEDLAADGCITKAPGGRECPSPSPADRRKLGMIRQSWTLYRWHSRPATRP